MIGKNLNEIMTTDYLDAAYHDVLQQFRQAGQWRGAVTQVAKDGTKRSILSSVTLLRNEAGEPFGAVALNRDITQ